MRVELIKKDNKTVGYKLVAETLEDNKVLGSIRNMQFWGFDETKLEYNGITTNKTNTRIVESVTWMQALPEFQERNVDAIEKFKKELLGMYFDAEIVKQYCKGIYKDEQMDVKYFIEYKHNKENE